MWKAAMDARDVSREIPGEDEVVRLFGQHTESAVRLAFHLTRDREAALDISQEAFVRALESLPPLEELDSAPAWLHRIVVNLCRDWMRRRGAERRAKGAFEKFQRAPTDDPAQQVERSETHALLREKMMALPMNLREAVALVCVEGYTPKDAAAVLGIPDGTLRHRLHEGRTFLRVEFDRMKLE